MYEKFFRLQRSPFRMVPDQDCLHMTGQHADVISGAVFGVLERKGFVVLTAEAGLGKTTAIRAVMDMLAESHAQTSLISHPTLSAEDFLELALLNFGMPAVASSKAQRLKVLENFLTMNDREGRVSVLIVDEAHKLPPEALEEIRLLGNMQNDEHRLLQILLVGQDELNVRLNLPELWQLKQRIAFRLSLNRLDRNGTEEYIRYRWNKAGGRELPFDVSALDAIAEWSNGIPRVINTICDNALMLALSEATRTIQVEQIQMVCQDLQLAPPSSPRRPPQFELSLPESEQATLVRRGVVGGTPPEPDPWSAERPSLLKKWRGFLDTRPAAQSLSLKKHF
jgi:general secretion pathway protein A